jgi:hypothetical protein
MVSARAFAPEELLGPLNDVERQERPGEALRRG